MENDRHLAEPKMKRFPIVLDFDASVRVLPLELRIALGNWQEAIRYGCSVAWIEQFARLLHQRLPLRYGTVFTGSRDFHHLSWPLIARHAATRPLRVVVFDNHADNTRFPFGVHRGSWVRRVAMMPQVSHVHVVGITAKDTGSTQCWKNYLGPLRADRLSYWSIGVDMRWARWAGAGRAVHAFDDADTMMEAFCGMLDREPQDSYLSIDKHVFATHSPQPGRDQGALYEHHLDRALETLGGHLIASDVTGEISTYQYQAHWKRWLSADTRMPPGFAAPCPQAQQELNRRLIMKLGG